MADVGELFIFLRKEFQLRPESTALLIVDMNNGCCQAGGFVARLGADVEALREPIPKIRQLLDFWRIHQLPVVFVTSGMSRHDPALARRLRWRFVETQEGKGMAHFPAVRQGVEAGMLDEGGYWWSVIEELAPRPGERVVTKMTSSAFNSSPLDKVLREMEVDSLIITGVATNLCVEGTARDASDRGYNCILVSDGTATFDADLQRMTERNFAIGYGKVMTVQQVLAIMGG
jgi:nicotinamidase-related amidase